MTKRRRKSSTTRRSRQGRVLLGSYFQFAPSKYILQRLLNAFFSAPFVLRMSLVVLSQLPSKHLAVWAVRYLAAADASAGISAEELRFHDLLHLSRNCRPWFPVLPATRDRYLRGHTIWDIISHPDQSCLPDPRRSKHTDLRRDTFPLGGR